MAKDGILIIDDDEDDRYLLKSQLKACGFNNVLEAGNGREGINVINILEKGGNMRLVGVIICDMVMPDVDGNTIVDYLREQVPDIPIVIITGLKDDKAMTAMRGKGVKDYLIKPVDNAQLTKVVGKNMPN